MIYLENLMIFHMSHIIGIYQCKIIFVHRYISDISDFCYINKFLRLMIYQNFFMIYRWYISSMFDYFNNFKYQRYISDISVIYQWYIMWYFVRIHIYGDKWYRYINRIHHLHILIYHVYGKSARKKGSGKQLHTRKLRLLTPPP